MALVDPPTTDPYPEPSHASVVGYTDATFERLLSMDRDALLFLLPGESVVSFPGPDGTDMQAIRYYLYGANELTAPYGPVVRAWTTRAERQDYLREHSDDWFGASA